MGWVGGRRGGRIGTKVCESDVGVFFIGGPVGVLLLLRRESLAVTGGDGSTHAPAHASRRCTYVRKPSFHFISSSSISCRLRFRESIAWAKSSGVSKR